jgi:hypothetical protein
VKPFWISLQVSAAIEAASHAPIPPASELKVESLGMLAAADDTVGVFTQGQRAQISFDWFHDIGALLLQDRAFTAAVKRVVLQEFRFNITI